MLTSFYVLFIRAALLEGFPAGSVVKNLPANEGDVGSGSPCIRKIPWRRKWQSTPVFLPEKIPWTEEPGRLQSMGSQRVEQDLATDHTHTHTQLIYNVMLVFSVQQSDSVIHTYTDTHICIFFIIFSIMACHRILKIVPCDVM